MQRRDHGRSKVQLPAPGDVLLATLLSVAGAVQALATAEGHRVAVTVLVALGLAALAFRRLHPMPTFLAVAGALVAAAQTPDGGSQVALPIGALIATFTLGQDDPRERSVVAAVALLAAMAGMMLDQGAPPGDAIFALAIYGGAFGLGRVAGTRARHAREARAETELLRREHEAFQEEALREERTRVARELHDIVGHSISIVVVQAQAVRTCLRSDAQADAMEGLHAIEMAGREAMQEMRRLLGVLRAGDDQVPLAPQPGIDHLEDLVSSARAAGERVGYRVTGHARAVAPGLSVTLYRALQEALTNCRRHAPAAPVDVELQWLARDVRLVVENDHPAEEASAARAPRRNAHGLVGMTERASLFGGVMVAGASDVDGTTRFRLELRLPTSAEPVLGAPRAASVE